MIKPEVKFYDLDILSKQIKFRKWIAKDRRLFKEQVSSANNDSLKIGKITINNLLINCLDTKYPLSIDEIRYILIKIRENSISDEVEFNTKCDICGNIETHKVKISDLVSISYNPIKEIIIDDINIKLGEIKNIDFYNTKILDSTNPILTDLILRIESINNEIDFSYDDLVDYFDNLETDILDKILEIYNKHRFKLDIKFSFKCKKCLAQNNQEYTDLPDFFPTKWLEA